MHIYISAHKSLINVAKVGESIVVFWILFLGGGVVRPRHHCYQIQKQKLSDVNKVQDNIILHCNILIKLWRRDSNSMA